MADTQITWLGHAAFRIDSPGGKRIYVDPFLENPKCPDGERKPERCDLIALTHGHDDHVGSTVEMAKRFGCPVIAQIELRSFLDSEGVEGDVAQSPNKGGTTEAQGIKVTLTDARHSSGWSDGRYLGEACGLVMEVENGTKLYFAGDTNAFMDMQLIGRIYEPDVAILPIGDHFTMGPKEASVALELLAVDRCIPCHYGTFPILRGTPDELRALATNVDVIAPEPGETVTV